MKKYPIVRKLIYYLATSLDGYIRGRDGTIDGFLPDGSHVKAYRESQQFRHCTYGPKDL